MLRLPAALLLLLLLLAGAAEAPGKRSPHTGHEPPPPDPAAATLSAMGQPAVAGGALAGVAALAYGWPRVRLMAGPLYSRVRRDEALDHATRERIYRIVREQPGIHAFAVAEGLGLSWSATAYHLRLLEDHALLVSRPVGRYRCFFLHGDPRAAFPGAVALLKQPTARRVLEAVRGTPGRTQAELRAQLGIGAALMSWHLRRLAREGLVRSEPDGRSQRYHPGPTLEHVADA